MFRLENGVGTGLHVTPVGVDIDEQLLHFGDNLALRGSASLSFPRSLPIDPRRWGKGAGHDIAVGHLGLPGLIMVTTAIFIISVVISVVIAVIVISIVISVIVIISVVIAAAAAVLLLVPILILILILTWSSLVILILILIIT